MKKIYKSLLLTFAAGTMGLALASCGKTTRNSSVPYGTDDKYNSETAVASATGDNTTYSMTMKQFYSRLRYNAYTTVTDTLKSYVYANELQAVKEVLLNEHLTSGVSDETKSLITLQKDGVALYSLEDTTLDYTGEKNNYEYIRSQMVQAISKSLSSAIFSTNSAETILGYEKEDAKKSADEVKTIETDYTKYIEGRKRIGTIITKDELAYTQPTDDSDVIVFTNFISLVENHSNDLLKSYLLTQAEQLSAKNALYQIADEEYIKAYNADEDDEPTKNSSYYLFDEDKLESTYDSTFKTYGTYKAVIIQFNSRREALRAMDAVWDDSKSVDENYVALYNYCYPYEETVTSVSDDRFTYNITEDKDDLDDLTDDIKSLITDTLEDGDYLKEPRDIADKYVMVYKLDSSYTIHADDDVTEAKEYEDLTDLEKTKYDTIMKYDSICSSASGYTSTNYKSILYKVMNNDTEDDDLKIYDPLFEQKYYNSYSEFYELIDKKEAKTDVIFSYNGKEYTVDQFYDDAAKVYANSIFTNFFQLEYAYTYYDEYVDEDTHDDNEDSIDDAIKEFKKGNNSTYSKDFGLSNFLLATYGYETKEDVLKYSYDASTCLSSYKAEKVFEGWAVATDEKDDDGLTKYAMSDEATKEGGILDNILKTGNQNYSTLFSIDLDHILINIDADGDGSPDDPEEFLKEKDDAFRADFEANVVALAQAIYTEAVSGKYGDNSLYEILAYIKNAYEEGAALKSDEYLGKTWDDFKKYNFLLTAEELASSGDITQESVSNFVTPFADYVKKVYEKVNDAGIDFKTDNKNGLFYVYDADTDTGKALTKTTDATEITIDSLCATVYGYHLLVVNSYTSPDSTKYEASDDEDYQKSIPVLLIDNSDDDDDDTENVVVYVDAENTQENAANISQLFVYYVEKANGATSSLSSTIADIMSELFDDAITEYTSSDFQTFLLLKKLNIQVLDSSLSSIVPDDKGQDVTYYANQITAYGENDEYIPWVDGTYTWERPED